MPLNIMFARIYAKDKKISHGKTLIETLIMITYSDSYYATRGQQLTSLIKY